MERKKPSWGKLIKKIEVASKDADFVRAAKHFVRVTSNCGPRAKKPKNINKGFTYTAVMKTNRRKSKNRFWERLKEWQKDPKFRKSVAEFVNLTTS